MAYTGPEASLPASYTTPAKSGSAQCTIGFQNISTAQSSLDAEQTSAAAEAKTLGCSFKPLSDQLSPTTQVNNFNLLLSQKVSAIVVYPIVPSSLAPSVAQAVKAGIPVIANNTPSDAAEPLPTGYSTRVLQGYDHAAYLRAKYLASKYPGGQFAILGLALPVSSLEYYDARTKYWAEKFGMKYAGEVDAQQDVPSSASTAMSAIVAKYQDVKAVFAYNDDSAVAAGTVARSSGAKIGICGGNGQKEAYDAIKSGTISCTVLFNFSEVGRQLVLAAYDAITHQGGTLPKAVAPPVTLVTSANSGSVKSFG